MRLKFRYDFNTVEFTFTCTCTRVPVVTIIIQLSPETTPGSGCSLQEEVPPLIIENELLRESSCNDFTAVAKLGTCVYRWRGCPRACL